jgi:hypothetical protein
VFYDFTLPITAICGAVIAIGLPTCLMVAAAVPGANNELITVGKFLFAKRAGIAQERGGAVNRNRPDEGWRRHYESDKTRWDD